jgi:type I restriction enzyme S subunit
MIAHRIQPKFINEKRLDPYYYSPEFLTHADLMKLRFNQRLRVDEYFEVLDGTHDSVETRANPDEKYCIPFLRAQDIGSCILNSYEGAFLSSNDHFSKCKRSQIKHGDILLNIMASTGDSCLYHDGFPAFANANRAVGILRKKKNPINEYQPRYVCAVLSSTIGSKELARNLKGSIQKRLNLEDISDTLIPLVAAAAQTYIGNKVRQAERLRALALDLERDIERLSVTEVIAQTTGAADMRSNRVVSSDMWARFDSKYYGTKAMAVHKVCQLNGTILSDLAIGISNGFEERTFVDEGRIYITVSEVSSGRLNIDNAPKIDLDVSVPPKAIVHERCVLVVRTGSIGNAVKVFHEDAGVSISSHLIRLEFETESCAASVAAFLNSKAGKILQQKISYGAVQPQIGQEELTALSIPNSVLANGEQILKFENAKEVKLRSSSRLTIAAKLLVEALIEGQVIESDLVAAQKALEAGDRSVDREILSRLTRKGMDVTDQPPLFPDLEELYNALDALNTPEDAP